MKNDTSTVRKPKVHRYGCLLIILILAGFFLLLQPWPHPPLWQIEKFSTIKFPPSSRVLNSHGRWFLETDIWAKIEMKKADVEPFIKSLPKPLSVSSNEEVRIRKFHTLFSWWKPLDAKRFKVVELQMPKKSRPNRVCKFLFDIDIPNKAVVYFEYADF